MPFEAATEGRPGWRGTGWGWWLVQRFGRVLVRGAAVQHAPGLLSMGLVSMNRPPLWQCATRPLASSTPGAEPIAGKRASWNFFDWDMSSEPIMTWLNIRRSPRCDEGFAAVAKVVGEGQYSGVKEVRKG